MLGICNGASRDVIRLAHCRHEEFGQKTVSVMLDGREAELEIVDHPSSEMSVESYCATYNPEVFVVVYSVVDRNSFKAAEDILLFLWKSDYISSKGVILVGNKADLERKREVPLAGEAISHAVMSPLAAEL
uniref:Uncharacterized protein n=1 Tax=Timema monikensis TaxID=170555 RepID=A0A7R9E5U8_9NEOP|nr:unnamed protein product [Timema monikensis]